MAIDKEKRLDVVLSCIASSGQDVKMDASIAFNSMKQSEATLIEMAFATCLQQIAGLGIGEAIEKGANAESLGAAVTELTGKS